MIAPDMQHHFKVVTVPDEIVERIDLDRHRAAVERALRRSFAERIALTQRNLEEVAKLEGLYGDWQQARSVKFAAYTLHRAAVDVDPLAADIWAPQLLRRRGGSRTDFLRTVQLLWRVRERGRLHGNLADEAMTLLCEDLAWRSAAAPAPAHGARRCEGRSRAPQGSAGGARAGSGGSRRGGDRGDDSGGGGSDGSDGGSSGSGNSRGRRFSWNALRGICLVVSTLLAVATFVFGPLHTPPPPAPVVPKGIVKDVQASPAVREPRAAAKAVHHDYSVQGEVQAGP